MPLIIIIIIIIIMHDKAIVNIRLLPGRVLSSVETV